MLTTVAVLIIVLGLMVSLARYVRDRSAQQLTRNLLRQLDVIMGEYVEQANARKLPMVRSIIPEDSAIVEEAAIRQRARLNNEDFVRVLRGPIARAWLAPANRKHVREQIGELPLSVYDEVTLRDAWGSPIVFMPREHRLIGMAPRGRPSFFFSAGPDRQYLTRDDNLYSYETSATPAK